jgi:hypothetical protein
MEFVQYKAMTSTIDTTDFSPWHWISNSDDLQTVRGRKTVVEMKPTVEKCATCVGPCAEDGAIICNDPFMRVLETMRQKNYGF